jgi:DNA-binding PucR family transcriptional regulator
MNNTEQMIREHAYQHWERAGRPDGRSEEFWLAAVAEFERKEGTGERKSGAPVRRSVEVRSETAADWGKRGREPSF